VELFWCKEGFGRGGEGFFFKGFFEVFLVFLAGVWVRRLAKQSMRFWREGEGLVVSRSKDRVRKGRWRFEWVEGAGNGEVT
jgi:hypothetical protein